MKINKKKVLKTLLLSLAMLVALALVILFFYLPRYLTRSITVTPREHSGEELTLVSYNVRCYSPFDTFQKSWFYRAELVSADMAEIMPDIVCLQEMNFLHYNYLRDVMPGYDSLIKYRNNSVLGEGCAIFYRSDRFEMIESGHFWLSETPEVKSKDWDSAHYRICVYVCLKDLNTGKEFIVFNTHLDHKSEEARIKGIEVVLEKIAALEGRPAFLLGDMNATEESRTIQFTKESFSNAKEIANVSKGSSYTYNNWGASEGKRCLDYILISRGDATVDEYAVANNNHYGVYSSDHCPVYVRVRLK